MPMDQFPPDDFHLNLLHALWSRRTTASILIRGPIRRGSVLSSLQAEKQIRSLAPGSNQSMQLTVKWRLYRLARANSTGGTIKLGHLQH